MEYVEYINEQINSVVWGPVTLAVLLFVGLMFSIMTKFFQVTGFRTWMKKTLGSLFDGKKDGEGVSAFEAMSAALSGCMGTGNIVGVATALTIGGAGAIFWMWVSAILGMMTAFAENILSVKYHQKEKDGTFSGGPMYYIEKGLKNKPLAVIFSVMCMCASFGIGNMAQANSVTSAFNDMFGVQPIFTAVIIAFLTGIIIIGGVKRLVKVTSKLVPFMTLIYLVAGIAVVLFNIENLVNVFKDIVTQALGISQVAGGISGALILNSMRTGISKGVFSNEAGLGSSSIAHGASGTKEPVTQGMWGIFQVFTDTIIGCSITAFVILSSGVMSGGKDGVELTSEAFSSLFGSFGGAFVTFSITLFAFSTLITWSYYGEKSVSYITKGKGIMIYRFIFCLVIVIGGIAKMDLVWKISDTLNGLMAVPNLIALIILYPVVKKEVKRYFTGKNLNKKRKSGAYKG